MTETCVYHFHFEVAICQVFLPEVCRESAAHPLSEVRQSQT